MEAPPDSCYHCGAPILPTQARRDANFGDPDGGLDHLRSFHKECYRQYQRSQSKDIFPNVLLWLFALLLLGALVAFGMRMLLAIKPRP